MNNKNCEKKEKFKNLKGRKRIPSFQTNQRRKRIHKGFYYFPRQTHCLFWCWQISRKTQLKKMADRRYLYPLWNERKEKSKRLPDRQKILHHPERTTMDSMLRGQNSLGNRRTDRQSFSNRWEHKKSNHPKD